MMNELLDPAIVLDNPMLTKHARSRLRRGQVIPWAVVVFVLCLLIVWFGQASGGLESGSALATMLGLETLILAIVGAQQVLTSVGGARESGVLDFHRVSPQPPLWLVIGYFLGGPIREYLLFLITVPFALLMAQLAPLGIVGLLQVWTAMFLAAWILQLISLLTGLTVKKPRGGSRGGMVGLVIFMIFLFNGIFGVLGFAASSLDPEHSYLPFFGIKIHWLVLCLINTLPVIGFLLLACVRKMRSERAHLYTKAQALSALGTLSVLLLGAFWGWTTDYEVAVIAMVYALTLAGMILLATTTPDLAEYTRGVRLVEHEGRRRPGAWTDEGSNRVATVLACLIVFAATTLAAYTVAGGPDNVMARLSNSIAVGVFTLAYVGFGYQYFLLRLPKSGAAMFGLFLFFAWLVPILAGSIVAAASSGSNETSTYFLLGLSPVTGIGLSAGNDTTRNVMGNNPARLAAILPAILFTFVFKYLLVSTQRKLDRLIREGLGLKRKKPASPFDDIDFHDPKRPEPDAMPA
jgi:hypothetical protein